MDFLTNTHNSASIIVFLNRGHTHKLHRSQKWLSSKEIVGPCSISLDLKQSETFENLPLNFVYNFTELFSASKNFTLIIDVNNVQLQLLHYFPLKPFLIGEWLNHGQWDLVSTNCWFRKDRLYNIFANAFV